ncbi:FAD-dependent oxidoreductase [Streptomonospora sediminis]
MTDFDVVVAGGGAAGIAAAVGARQAGAAVLLVERYPYLGGAATISSVLTYCGFFDQAHEQVVGGVGADMLRRLQARGVYHEMAGMSRDGDASALAERLITVDPGSTDAWTGHHFVLLDLETTKLVCDEVVTEAGVDVRLHSTLVGAARDERNRITEVQVHGRGGTERVTAGSFVDASGDGALLAASGAGTRVAPVAERQTSTLVCRAGGVPEDADLSTDGIRAALAAYARETGENFPREGGIAVRLPVTGQAFLLLVDEQTDVLDAASLTRDEMNARRQAWRYLAAFQAHLRGWHSAHLVETGPQLGIREARHLIGCEELTRHDVVNGRKRPDDAIARCGWPIEDHTAPGVTEYHRIEGDSWYDIPYGAITSADTGNLWAAGRLTAADRGAYASVRVMGAAFATGHAAGVAAARHSQGHPHDVAAVRAELIRQGAFV